MELKKLNEAMDIRNKKIMQLEAQIGHASDLFATRNTTNDSSDGVNRKLLETLDRMVEKMSQQSNNPSNNIVINACGMEKSGVTKNSVSTQAGASYFPCDVCRNVCISLGHNRNQAEIHEDSGNVPSPADELGAFHPSGSRISPEKSDNIALNPSDSIWLCKTCGKDVSSCEDLDAHMEKEHSDNQLDPDEQSQL